MSTANRSDAIHSRASLSSSYGMGFGDSDDEDSWTEGECGDVGSVDYWFGQKYFECVTAQHLVCRGGFTVDMVEVDSRMTIMLQRYPYQTVFDQLSGGTDNVRDPGQVFQSLMVIIGRTMRNGTRETRAQLLRQLRQPLDVGIRGSTESLPRETSDPETLASPDWGRFASALNEYGQEHGGFTPTYNYETGGTYPNGCVAVVRCGEFTFRAAGRNKKRARHAAAYQACLHYKIAV